MNPQQVATVFRRNMTALVVDAAERRHAKARDAATGKPSRPAPKQAA